MSANPESAPRNLYSPAELYLDLLKGCLTRSLFGNAAPTEMFQAVEGRSGIRRFLMSKLQKLLAYRDLTLARVKAAPYGCGRYGETLIKQQRIQNLQNCVTDVLFRRIPGDLIETGVWRGGASIFMRGILKAYGDTTRTVWVADSFQGLPKPNAEDYPADEGSTWHEVDFLKIDLASVKENFARYNLLDEQVRFLVGWFRDTLPLAPIKRLSVMRLDGDMYESTIDALRHLYPKLSIGGYVIIDDYRLPACQAAVEDYRTAHGIREPIKNLGDGIWQRLASLIFGNSLLSALLIE